MQSGERGESLIEVVVACAIVAVVAAAVGGGLIAATHRFGPDPVMQALEQTAASEMRTAVDLAKYQGTSLPSVSIATTAPLPSGSPLPIALSLTSQTAGDGSVTLTISATSANDAGKRATLSEQIAAPAPLPGSSIDAPLRGAAPQ